MQKTQREKRGKEQTCSQKHYIQAACWSPARSSHSCGLLHLTVLHAETPPAPFTRATEDQMVEIWNVHTSIASVSLRVESGG